MRATVSALMSLTGLSLVAHFAHAHHSFPGVYDTRQQLFLEGPATEFLFRNPHTFIFLEVTDEAGDVSEWHLELPPKWALERRGLSESAVSVGDKLLVTCNPARDGSRSCGLGQRGGFYRDSDGFIYGLDPRSVN